MPQALPAFAGTIGYAALAELARRDDVESRIVQRRGTRRDTQHGPFRALRAQRKDWTLLVSGVNLHDAGADELLRRFSFVPQARLDDVMVSYAAPGGGVGPHVDSYDVFLLQGPGRRRWTVWDGVRKSYDCRPGDLLYLPPGVKHDGVALDACFTYSIGFRAPRGQELGAAFLDWLHARGLPEARYRDPQLRPSSAPARIPPGMIDFAARVLGRIRWNRADVAAFLGEYLTTPKGHVVFGARSAGRLRDSVVHLDPKTQLLYNGRRFFINGEAVTVAAAAASALRALADRRRAEGRGLARGGLESLVAQWQRNGYVYLDRR